MEPELIIKSDPLDFELCELLGRGSADFIVLCADGEQFDFAGTPYDSPREREVYTELVKLLNSPAKKGYWPKYFETWKREICKQFKLPAETTAKDFHPTISFKISRVCHGYSKNLHCAVVLFETLGDRVKSWSICKQADGTEVVIIASARGETYREHGEGMARLIALAVKRLLEAEPIQSA